MATMNSTRDVVIIGGGAAGLSAALMLGRAGRDTLVVDAGAPRNRFTTHMHGFLGHDGVDPAELLRRGRREVETYGVHIIDGAVDMVADTPRGLHVSLTNGDHVSTRAIIVATGMTDQLPPIPGLAEQWGSTVLHCPYCHGWEVRGQRLGVLAMAPNGLHQAQVVRQWSDQLTVFTASIGPLADADARRLRSRGIRLVDDPVSEVISDEAGLSGVRTSRGEVISLDAIFTAGAAEPHDGFLAGLELTRSDTPLGSFLAVDEFGTTSHPRIWAVGNVVNPGATVVVAASAGVMAGGMVNMVLVTEDFDAADTPVAADAADPAAYWEDQYASNERRWSGRVNATMADVVDTLSPGGALDLGCGEGGDAVWLAERGWHVTAVDISATAAQRGAAGAEQRGVSDRVTWVAHDLATWQTDETFDLVTASFFHSTVDLPRTEILRRAAAQIRPGGHLLLVSHVFESDEDIPPWAKRHHERDQARRAHDHQDDHHHGGDHGGDGDDPHSALLLPHEELAELDLDIDQWEVVVQEIRTREATGPDGLETATLKDGVLLLRRH